MSVNALQKLGIKGLNDLYKYIIEGYIEDIEYYKLNDIDCIKLTLSCIKYSGDINKLDSLNLPRKESIPLRDNKKNINLQKKVDIKMKTFTTNRISYGRYPFLKLKNILQMLHGL